MSVNEYELTADQFDCTKQPQCRSLHGEQEWHVEILKLLKHYGNLDDAHHQVTDMTTPMVTARAPFTYPMRTLKATRVWGYVKPLETRPIHRPENVFRETKANGLAQVGFYMTLAAVPIFYVGYSLAYGSPDNYFARQYQKFKDGKKDSQEKDLLHQTVMAQAISDRARMKSFPRESTGPELRFPEYVLEAEA